MEIFLEYYTDSLCKQHESFWKSKLLVQNIVIKFCTPRYRKAVFGALYMIETKYSFCSTVRILNIVVGYVVVQNKEKFIDWRWTNFFKKGLQPLQERFFADSARENLGNL
jgi:hypothetical protein